MAFKMAGVSFGNDKPKKKKKKKEVTKLKNKTKGKRKSIKLPDDRAESILYNKKGEREF